MSLILIVALAFVAQAAQAAVKGEEVQYKAGNTVLKGYLAYDDAQKGKRPGCIGGARVVGTQRVRARNAHACSPRSATRRWRWTCTAMAIRRITRTRPASSPARCARPGAGQAALRRRADCSKASDRRQQEHPPPSATAWRCDLLRWRAGRNLKGVVSFTAASIPSSRQGPAS